MDFSSIPRALESLRRRQPPLNAKVLDLSNEIATLSDPDAFLSSLEQLLWFHDCSSSSSNDDEEGNKDGDDKKKDKKKTTTDRWEPLAVGLYVATEVLQQKITDMAAGEETAGVVYMDGPRVPLEEKKQHSEEPKLLEIGILDTDHALHLCQLLHKVALAHMEHKEPRVRTLVAKAVGSYCRVSASLSKSGDDAALRREIYQRLVASIHDHLQKGRAEVVVVAAPDEEKDDATKQEQQQDEDQETYSRTSEGALDDTTGWRALETNWLCLAALISALGQDYWGEFPFEPQQEKYGNDGVDVEGLETSLLLQDCEYSAISHKNRHVRAAAIAVLEQWIVAAAAGTENDHSKLLTEPTSLLRKTAVAVVKTGLADNWSQVRMAASVLCRVFLTTLQRICNTNEAYDANVQDIYPALLPRMCLNRFYLAQGVKLYSHDTWKRIVQNRGVELVATYLPAVIRYDVQMCDADNHVVREAACQAIAELAVRLGGHAEYHDTLLNHIGLLLQALLMCFHDESWPVRDEACLACGILCKGYPEECRPELGTLWERWTEQLTDQIWSVRQDAAVALGDALQAYGLEFLEKIQKLITKILPAARDQAAMTQEEFKAHQNDMQAHTDSTLYSCGSLAPKLRKGGAGRIGCSSCGIDRPKAPWEATDGCIYLIRELIIIGTKTEDNDGEEKDPSLLLSDDYLLPLLRELADVCRVQHFPQSSELRTTLWRQLPTMARALGKQRYKRLYFDIFMDLLFSNLEARSASQLSIHAAGQCAEELAELVGVAIFRGRLEDFQRETFDRVMRERAMMPKGPVDDAAFSPFGPAGLLASIGGPVIGSSSTSGPPAAVFPGHA